MKRNYKQFIALLLSIGFILMLAACGNTVKENDAAATPAGLPGTESPAPAEISGPEMPAETNDPGVVLLPDDNVVNEWAYTRDGQILGAVGEAVYQDDNITITLSGWHGTDTDTDSGIDLTVYGKTSSFVDVAIDYVVVLLNDYNDYIMTFEQSDKVNNETEAGVELRVTDKILVGYSVDLNTVKLQCSATIYDKDNKPMLSYAFMIESILGEGRQIDNLTCYTSDSRNIPETSMTEGNTLDLSGSGNVTINGQTPGSAEFDQEMINMMLWSFGTLFDDQYVQAWGQYGRPANKNAFDVNGTIVDAKTATKPEITVDFEKGDTVDSLKAGCTYEDVFTAWGPCQSLRQSGNDIVLIFKHDTSLESLYPEQGFDGVEAKVYLKFTDDLSDMVPYKVVLEFSVD